MYRTYAKNYTMLIKENLKKWREISFLLHKRIEIYSHAVSEARIWDQHVNTVDSFLLALRENLFLFLFLASGPYRQSLASLACRLSTPVYASVVTWHSTCVSLSSHGIPVSKLSLFYKDTRPVTGLGPTLPNPLWPHFNLIIYICKDPISK